MTEPTHEMSPEPSGPGDISGPKDEAELAARRVEQTLALGSLWSHIVVLVVVLAGSVGMFVQLFSYSERSRQFPLITLIAVFVMIAIRMVQVIVVARRDGEPPRDRSRLIREAVMLVWVVAMGVSVVLFGLIPGSLIFLVAYLAVHRPAGLVTSVLVTLGLWLGVYLLFVRLLNLPMRPGVIF